ncbi:MAG: hypothetical protein JWR63_3726 [Conexibacter sp.]|nr:hypothetical protein [Conexibacter sp.]
MRGEDPQATRTAGQQVAAADGAADRSAVDAHALGYVQCGQDVGGIEVVEGWCGRLSHEAKGKVPYL